MNIRHFKNGVFHVHTHRCRHASKEDDEAYVKRALELGAEMIAFTDHAPFPGNPFTNRMDHEQLPEYIASLKNLKQKYSGDIEVIIGLEIEYMPSFMSYYEELRDNPDIEILMIGQHMFELSPGDYSFMHKDLWFPEVAVSLVCAIKTGLFDGVAHPDRIYKFEKTWTPGMEEVGRAIITEAGQRGMFLEQNEESKRAKNYYWSQFWDMAEKEKYSFNTPLMLIRGSDAHSTKEMVI